MTPLETLAMLKDDRKNFADGSQEAFMLDTMIYRLTRVILNEGIGATITTEAGCFTVAPMLPVTVKVPGYDGG